MSRTTKQKKYGKRERFQCGPGGMDCVCCFPSPGSMERRKLIKAFRRHEAATHFRLEWEMIMTTYDLVVEALDNAMNENGYREEVIAMTDAELAMDLHDCCGSLENVSLDEIYHAVLEWRSKH